MVWLSARWALYVLPLLVTAMRQWSTCMRVPAVSIALQVCTTLSLCPQFIFTAKPLGGGSSITSKVSNPRNGQFRGLKPSTQ